MSEDAAPPPPTEAPAAEAAEGEEAAPAPAFAPPCMDLGEHIVKTDFFEVGSNAVISIFLFIIIIQFIYKNSTY